MEVLIEQIRKGLDNHLYLLCLNSALTLPDICGAMQRTNGEASGQSYRDWFKQYVEPNFDFLTAGECYDFRCRMLHQARSTPKLSKGKGTAQQNITPTYSHIAFAEPSRASINVRNSRIGNSVGPKIIDVVAFTNAIISGVETWMKEKSGTQPYTSNLAQSIKYRKDGIPPLIAGVPMIY